MIGEALVVVLVVHWLIRHEIVVSIRDSMAVGVKNIHGRRVVKMVVNMDEVVHLDIVMHHLRQIHRMDESAERRACGDCPPRLQS